MNLINQDNATVAAGPIKSVSFFKSQEPGEPASFHVIVCDLSEGKLMRASLDRDAAMRLGETIKTATGP